MSPHILKTTATQPRVALGQDQSETTAVRAYGFAHTSAEDYSPYFWVRGWQPDPGYLPHYGFRHVATVEIAHPAIMAGSREDVVQDFARIAANALRRAGLLEEDAVGQDFFTKAAFEESVTPTP